VNLFRRRSALLSPRVLAVLAAFLLPVRVLSQTPTATRVLPAFGPVGGNNVVIIARTNFQAGATVSRRLPRGSSRSLTEEARHRSLRLSTTARVRRGRTTPSFRWVSRETSPSSPASLPEPSISFST